MVAQEYAELIYNGLWFSAYHQDLFAFVASNQRFVFGRTRAKLFEGKATVVGRKSEHSLYSKKLAKYEAGDQFDHDAARCFISRRRRGSSSSRGQGLRPAGPDAAERLSEAHGSQPAGLGG